MKTKFNEWDDDYKNGYTVIGEPMIQGFDYLITQIDNGKFRLYTNPDFKNELLEVGDFDSLSLALKYFKSEYSIWS